ncbi:MFS transporter [Alkalicella caledoniensis]|uniref:MFS transporter n=1 Tax=Alkalicella caledoniensis TaxID=2731377 RepID=A0A7G9W4N9_ALKCA|nr:MFS transporter [Alkalicella caledoniensis]QNO13651.1 MFS transporter [Alkalicella caledoniensis]
MSKIDLSESDINHNIKCNTRNGIFAVIGMNLVTPFIGILAKTLGADAYEIALLSSLPALMSVISMIPGGIMVDRFQEKKKVTGYVIALTRFFFLLLAITPNLPASWRVFALVLTYGLMNFPGGISNVAWQSFIASAIPAKQRAQAFAYRNKITSICGIIVTLIAGQILRIYNINKGFPILKRITGVDISSEIMIYQIFFVLACGFAVYEVYYHMKMKEPVVLKTQRELAIKKKLLSNIKTIFKYKPFLLFGICSLLFHFGWQMGWPLFTIYQIDYLGADGTWVSYISVVNGLAAFITYPIWSKVATKKGNNYTVVIATFAIAMSPFLYAISWNLYVLLMVNFFMGTAVAGINLVLFNSLLEVVPDEDRTLYIAIYSTLISISAMLAPMLGAHIYKVFNIYVALCIAGSFRLFGSFSFLMRFKYLARTNNSPQLKASNL